MRTIPTSLVYFLVIITLFISACRTSFSFIGGNVDANLSTFTIESFDNDANLVVPTLSQDFSLELTNYFLNNTRLNSVKTGGDLTFSGAITRYEVTPVAIQGNETAAQNRLTIAVFVRCENKLNEEKNWEETFSQFTDFDGTASLSSVEDELIKDINEKLTQDVFNKTFSDW